MTSFLWVVRDRLTALLLNPGNMTYWGWERLLCLTVSAVLPIPLEPGSRFHGRPNAAADTPALTSFLAGVRRRLQHLLFVVGVPCYGWEEFLVRGVGNVLRLPPTVG